MSLFSNVLGAFNDARLAQSDDLDKLRRMASRWYLIYLWGMTACVTAIAAGWSDYWLHILVINSSLAAISTYAHKKAPDAVHTRVTIAGSMLANWMNLIYAASHYASGEFILDAHMIYFVLNSILLAYFCWRTLFVINAVTVVHHLGLNVLAPLLIWPSAEFSWLHLATHVAMATIVTVSGLAISVTVARLFAKSSSMVVKLRNEMASREALEQEEKRLRDEATKREQLELEQKEAIRLEREKAAEEKRARDQEQMRAREAEHEREEALRRSQIEEQKTVVDALATGMKRLSQGDLTTSLDQAFPTAYESLRMDFNATVASLSDLILDIATSVETINSSSREVVAASDDLARRTEKSAATLEETSSAADQLAESVRGAADRAKQANQVATVANSKANESTNVVTEATNAMTEIEEASGQITKIISVINDIAFQTNLLALNAGVEAARAGEAGRGFAVVASEVRALAQRSADASREIDTLISNSNSQVEKGVRLVGTAGTALADIISAVTDIAGHVDAIATSTHEQATGIREVNSSVSDLDRTMQQNAAMTEETTAALQILQNEADRLKSLITKFSLGAAADAGGHQAKVA